MTSTDSNLQVRPADGHHPPSVVTATQAQPGRADAQATSPAAAEPDLQRIAEAMTQLAVDLPWSMELSFNADVKDSVIVVRSVETGEVVRQIPSEEAVALQRFIEGGNPKDESPLGLLLDTLT